MCFLGPLRVAQTIAEFLESEEIKVRSKLDRTLVEKEPGVVRTSLRGDGRDWQKQIVKCEEAFTSDSRRFI